MLETLLIASILTMGHAVAIQLNATDSCNRPVEAEPAALAALLQFVPPLQVRGTINNTECQLHSRIFQEELQKMKLWALQMYDSSARLGSSLLNGNMVHLGDFKQCVAVQRSPEHLGGGPSITGRYCNVAVYMEPTGPPSKWRELHALLDVMKSHEAMSNAHQLNDLHLPTFSPLQIGFCIPDSCTHLDLEDSIVELLHPINHTSGIDFRVRLGAHSCLNARENPVDNWTFITYVIAGSLLMLAVVGTYFESAHTAQDGLLLPSATKGLFARLMVAFSFRHNWRMLIDTDVPEDELSCLHGVRFISSFMIFTIHKLIFNLYGPFANRTELAHLLEGDWTMLFRAFWNWVDAFVVMSGLLTAFYAFKKLSKGEKLNIPKMYIQRYIKFTPMVVFWALITQNLMQHQVSGENFVRFIEPYVTNCKRGLWPVISYTSVFEGLNKMCYPPSHQLVTDMHMYLMSPFIILGIWKYPKHGFATVAAVMVALSASKYSTVLNNQLGSFLFYGMSTETTVASANTIYVNAMHRLTPYLMGITLGYILQTSGGKQLLSRVQMSAGSAIALACAAYSLFGVSHSARRDYVYNASEAAIFGTLQPVMWSFALCWLVYCCATNQAPAWLKNLLTWKKFVIFSRLSYAVYLTQIYVIAINIGNAVHPLKFAVHRLVDLNEIFAVAVTSLLSTLILLLPLQDISGIIFGGYKAPNYARYAKSVEEQPEGKAELIKCPAEE